MLTGFLQGAVAMIVLALVIFLIRYLGSRESKPKEQPTSTNGAKTTSTTAPKPKGLSPGTQVILSTIAIFAFFIFGNVTKFLAIFESPWWIQLALIFVIWRAIWFVVAPLGQELRMEPTRILLNGLFIIAIVVAIAGYLGWQGEMPKIKFPGSEQKVGELKPSSNNKNNKPPPKKWQYVEDVDVDKVTKKINNKTFIVNIPKNKRVETGIFVQNNTRWLAIRQLGGPYYKENYEKPELIPEKTLDWTSHKKGQLIFSGGKENTTIKIIIMS